MTTLFTWLVQCLIGGFCFGWTLTISFSVFFLLIRKYTNGYHAATYSKCLFCSILLEVVLLASISYVFRTGLALLFLTMVHRCCIQPRQPTHDFCHKYHILDKTDSGLQEQVVYYQHVAFVLSFEFSTLAEVRLK